MNKNDIEFIKDNIFSFNNFLGNEKVEDININPYFLASNEYKDDNFIIKDIKEIKYESTHFYVLYTFNINKNLHSNFIVLEYQLKLFLEQNTSVCL